MTEKGKQILNTFEPIAFNQTKEALLTLTNEEIEIVHKGVALYAKGLKSSRIQNAVDPEPSAWCRADNSKKIESLPEIFSRLSQLGFTLELFNENDGEGLYEIFQEVIDSGSQFPTNVVQSKNSIVNFLLHKDKFMFVLH